MSTTPFPIQPVYTGISIAYRNEAMIADRVSPRVTPVPRKEFRYNSFPVEELLTVPDTKMGRRSEANTIELTASEVPGVVDDFALSDLVPNDDVDNAPEGYDPMAHATEYVTNLMMLDREVRVANTTFAPGTYPSGYKAQLSGSSQWSDPSSNPFQALWNACDVPLARPNLLVLGQPTWTSMATNANLIAKLYGAASTIGKARLQDLAEALEIDEVIVGRARVNTARKGQTASLQRAWGKHAALLHIDKLANNERGLTFGMTVPKGARATRVIPEPKIGLGGSQRVQVEEQLKEVIVASNCGYLFQDAVA